MPKIIFYTCHGEAMNATMRWSEKWFQRGLWLVALAFSGFLIGLGGTIVDNIRDVEPLLTQQQFIDQVRWTPLEKAQKQAEERESEASERLDQANQKGGVAKANYDAARATFENWLATREATSRPDQDPELVTRTRALDNLKAAERQAQRVVESQKQAVLDARQARNQAEAPMADLRRQADLALERAERSQQLRIFLYRLALTLPLLLIAGWLFARKRKSQYWPFVWGFIFFAGFAFFVELLPYLPSYGGYVRYIVGIIVTAVAGRQAIVGLQRYLALQRAAEALPDAQRRQKLDYDAAIARVANCVCPGCERSLDLKDLALDFCPHCGIHLFDHCTVCSTRKNAFAHFCHACGTARAGGHAIY
jgi:predicted RNA-binding Zn-ribbon protein involved in translation (DUF1610 family)